MAKLYFCYAAMNAGKSTVLLQASHNYEERGMRTLIYTSDLYTQADDGKVVSRLGLSASARLYKTDADLFRDVSREHGKSAVSCVFVDEAQFLMPDQVWQLARVADRLGIPVLCYGLRTDFRGELFAGSATLLAIADSLREIRTICRCGRKATMVVRRDEKGRAVRAGDQIGVERTQYDSLCRQHWEEEMGRVRKPRKTAAPAKAPALVLKHAASETARPPKRGKPPRSARNPA
jgi:thymidine kinase